VDSATRRIVIGLTLHRSGSPPLDVDPDLWIAALEIATVNGWRPLGTVKPTGSGQPDFEGYLEPGPQQVTHEDAIGFGEGLQRGLDGVPKELLPLRGGPFGEDNTLQLLRRASIGEIPGKGEIAAAIEIMSGPPRVKAESLAGFLLCGEFTINPNTSGHG